jgi:hypothetical protein
VERGTRVLVDDRNNSVTVELIPLSAFRVAELGSKTWNNVSTIGGSVNTPGHSVPAAT